MKSLRLLLACALLGSLGAPPAPARGRDPKAIARKHFNEAELHYQQGDFRQALAAYKRAQQYLRHPALIFNIAQCHRQLKEWDKALFFYRLYLSKSPKAANRVEVENRIREATQQLEAARRAAANVGRLSIVTQPEGAEIRIDQFTGPPVARSPAIVPVPAGQHLVQIMRPGYAPVDRTLTVTAGQMTLVEVTLTPMGAGAVTPPGREVTPPGREVTPPGREVTPPGREVTPPGREVTPPGREPPRRVTPPEHAPPPPPRAPYYKKWWFGTTIGLAGVALAFGIASGAMALKNHDHYVRNGEPKQLEKAKAAALGADVFFGVAGALALTALITTVLYVKRGQRERSRAQVTPSCGPTGCSLWVQGRF